MSLVTAELDLAHDVLSDLETLRISPGVEHRFHSEPRAGRRRPDEIHDGFVIDQRTPTPVQTDKREKSMLDLVPLTRARRIVADSNREPDFGGEDLQTELPGAPCVAIAAPAVGADQKAARAAIQAPAVEAPPAPNAFDGELGRLVTDPHVDDGAVAGNIVGAVGHRLPAPEVGKVVDVDVHRPAARPPGAARIAELAYQLFLFRIIEVIR